jgi:signal peptidase I
MSVFTKNLLTLENAIGVARSNWGAERSALVADALRSHGHPHPSVHLRVYGESMLPAIWPGDVVEIKSCSLANVSPGEIVLALRDGRLFLHRLISHSTPASFLLRGDSMPASDPPFPPEAFLGRLVSGEPAIAEPGARAAFRLKRLGVTWSRALGFLLCHFGFARRLALKLHSRRTASAHELRSVEAL